MKRLRIWQILHSNDDALADCISSYGSQLEHALISDMPEDCLARIAGACTDATFHLRVHEPQSFVSSLKVLGAQLETAYISIPIAMMRRELIGTWDNNTDNNTDIDICVAWNLCENLRSVHFYENTGIHEIKYLMAVPKSLLKVFYISLAKGNRDLKEIMDTIAGGTGGLESLELRCSGPPRGAFDKLVLETNCYLLWRSSY